VCRLRDRWPQRDRLAQRVAAQLTARGYVVQDTPLEVAERALARPHLSGSALVDVATGETLAPR
jgi:hypothetical protein